MRTAVWLKSFLFALLRGAFFDLDLGFFVFLFDIGVGEDTET